MKRGFNHPPPPGSTRTYIVHSLSFIAARRPHRGIHSVEEPRPPAVVALVRFLTVPTNLASHIEPTRDTPLPPVLLHSILLVRARPASGLLESFHFPLIFLRPRHSSPARRGERPGEGRNFRFLYLSNKHRLATYLGRYPSWLAAIPGVYSLQNTFSNLHILTAC